MTCPDCERYKISASMWRNKAYETSGHPLPWDADELIDKAILAEREDCAKLLDEMAAQDKHTNYYKVAANAIRARSFK